MIQYHSIAPRKNMDASDIELRLSYLNVDHAKEALERAQKRYIEKDFFIQSLPCAPTDFVRLSSGRVKITDRSLLMEWDEFMEKYG